MAEITTADYLQDLVNQKKNLVSTLQKCGVEANENEKFNTLVPKVEEVYEAGQKAEYDRFWDSFQKNGARTNYQYAFAGNNFDVELLNPKYVPIVPKQAAYMFSNNTIKYPTLLDYSEICKKIDFSQITNATSLFQNVCGKNITVDLSNCERASNAFNCNSGGSVDNVTLKVTEKLTDASMFFYYNSDLTTLTFTDDSVIAFAMNLSRCSKLTHESLMSVINALKDFAEKKTFTYPDATYSVLGFYGDPKGFIYNVLNASLEGTTLTCNCNGYFNGYEFTYVDITFIAYGVDISEEDVPYVKTIMIDVIDYTETDSGMVFDTDIIITTEKVTGSKTLTLGATNLAKLTDEEKKIATDKGWILA